MSAAMRWGLSVLDWRSHAIDELAEHPIGVLRAECGHLLMMVTTLHEKLSGVPREACAALRFDRARAEVPGRIHPPRSGDGEPDAEEPDADEPDADEPDADEPDADEPDPQAWITYVGDCGHHRVMSNPAHIGPCPDCDAQIGAT